MALMGAFDIPDEVLRKRPETLRPFVVLPARAIEDKHLEPLDIRVLAIMCRYSNMEGITEIGAASIAAKLGRTPGLVRLSLMRLSRGRYFKLIGPYRKGICTGTRQILYHEPGTVDVPIPKHLREPLECPLDDTPPIPL